MQCWSPENGPQQQCYQTQVPEPGTEVKQTKTSELEFGAEREFSCSVVSNSLQPHGLQHTRTPCPSPTPGAYSNSCPLSQWCHPTISSSVIPFSTHLQSFLASGSFPMSQFFASGGQSIGVSASASVLPMNIQSWFPFGAEKVLLIGWQLRRWEGRFISDPLYWLIWAWGF